MDEEQKLPDLPDNELEQLCSIIRFQLSKLVWIAIALSFSIFFLILSQISNSPLVLCVIPLLLLDVQTILNNLRETSQFLVPKDVISDSIESSGSFVFYTVQVVFWTTRKLSFSYSLIPLFIGLVGRLFVKTKYNFECHSFSGIVFFTARWVKAITLLTIGLKIDGMLDWSWIGTLWLVWVVFCFAGLLSFGAFILLMSTCCSYMKGESKIEELIGSSWFFYTVGGGLGTSGYFLFAFSQGDNLLIPCFALLLFALVFLLFTLLLKKDLVEWWSKFFATEEDSLDQEENERRVVSSRSIQVMKALKRPPKLLVRLSSAYFKPAKTQAVLPDKRRHLSDPNQKTVVEEENDHTTHRRYHSSSIEVVSSPKAKGSPCTMCCEKDADAVIMDCGHGGVCYECCLEMWKASPQCHLCRMEISQVLQVEAGERQFFKVISTTRAVYDSEELD